MSASVVVGNWKMNLQLAQATALASEIARNFAPPAGCTLVVAPPHQAITQVAAALSSSSVAVAGQSCHWATHGPFTGSVSAPQLKDAGASYVLVGHSERRAGGESLEDTRKQLDAALQAGLRPILCVGETQQQYDAQRTLAVVAEQFTAAVVNVNETQASQLMLAYEPVWAIGTGRSASAAQAQAVHLLLRELLRGRFDDALAQQIALLYGGSVNRDNAAELATQTAIDGLLVGGASLDAGHFLAIARAALRG